MGRVAKGRDAVRSFYEQAVTEQAPRPEPVMVVGEGDRVLGEIKVRFADGRVSHIVDLFEVRDGRIAALTYFIADYPVTG